MRIWLFFQNQNVFWLPIFFYFLTVQIWFTFDSLFSGRCNIPNVFAKKSILNAYTCSKIANKRQQCLKLLLSLNFSTNSKFFFSKIKYQNLLLSNSPEGYRNGRLQYYWHFYGACVHFYKSTKMNTISLLCKKVSELALETFSCCCPTMVQLAFWCN